MDYMENYYDKLFSELEKLKEDSKADNETVFNTITNLAGEDSPVGIKELMRAVVQSELQDEEILKSELKISLINLWIERKKYSTIFGQILHSKRWIPREVLGNFWESSRSSESRSLPTSYDDSNESSSSGSPETMREPKQARVDSDDELPKETGDKSNSNNARGLIGFLIQREVSGSCSMKSYVHGECSRVRKQKPVGESFLYTQDTTSPMSPVAQASRCHVVDPRTIVLPEEMRKRIRDLGGYKERCVVRKILKKSDILANLNRFFIPNTHSDLDFLEGDEAKSIADYARTKQDKYDMDVLFVEPCKENDCMLKMRKWKIGSGKRYCLTGSGWTAMAERNGLKPGHVVDLWSFRRFKEELCFAMVMSSKNEIKGKGVVED